MLKDRGHKGSWKGASNPNRTKKKSYGNIHSINDRGIHEIYESFGGASDGSGSAPSSPWSSPKLGRKSAITVSPSLDRAATKLLPFQKWVHVYYYSKNFFKKPVHRLFQYWYWWQWQAQVSLQRIHHTWQWAILFGVFVLHFKGEDIFSKTLISLFDFFYNIGHELAVFFNRISFFFLFIKLFF